MANGVRMISQEQVAKVLETGQVGDVVIVRFTVDGMGPFAVDVPVDLYEPDQVANMVANYVERIRGARDAVG
jgi:hypothetical protein